MRRPSPSPPCRDPCSAAVPPLPLVAVPSAGAEDRAAAGSSPWPHPGHRSSLLPRPVTMVESPLVLRLGRGLVAVSRGPLDRRRGPGRTSCFAAAVPVAPPLPLVAASSAGAAGRAAGGSSPRLYPRCRSSWLPRRVPRVGPPRVLRRGRARSRCRLPVGGFRCRGRTGVMEPGGPGPGRRRARRPGGGNRWGRVRRRP